MLNYSTRFFFPRDFSEWKTKKKKHLKVLQIQTCLVERSGTYLFGGAEIHPAWLLFTAKRLFSEC